MIHDNCPCRDCTGARVRWCNDPAILDSYSSHEDAGIRSDVVYNQFTSAETIRKMANEETDPTVIAFFITYKQNHLTEELFLLTRAKFFIMTDPDLCQLTNGL